ncbi:3-deoxy-manno-octulosonate cytidylyltransferase [bacterium]|nr:3-deoxy-manno-octulosonate cytidylyltransferase [bacterium]
MKTVVVIPARLNSTRLPNKVLLDLKGKTVVQRVYEQCLKAKNIDAVYIATDSIKVKESCENFTENIIMTDESHESGTDRIAQAIKDIECDVVINVQGDEPFMEPSLIEELANSFVNSNTVMTSALQKIKKVEDLKNINVVKVTKDKENNALYFSRSIIPHHRDEWDTLLNHHTTIPEPLKFYRHLGIYGYTKEFLIKYSSMEQSYLERLEKLEQLRVLENGYKIQMIETEYSSIGIDIKDDYIKALEILNDI